MANEKCMECESELISQLTDLELEKDKYKNYLNLAYKCLDVKDELCKALREENQELLNRIELKDMTIRKMKEAQDD